MTQTETYTNSRLGLGQSLASNYSSAGPSRFIAAAFRSLPFRRPPIRRHHLFKTYQFIGNKLKREETERTQDSLQGGNEGATKRRSVKMAGD